MIYYYLVISLIFITAIGYIGIRMRCSLLQEKRDFANEFNNLVIDYLNSQGNNAESMNKAIFLSERMQDEMGSFGLISYKMPFANRMIENYPAVLNILPSIKSEIHDHILSRSQLGQHVQILQNLMLRYIGSLDYSGDQINNELRNPLAWFRERVGNIIGSPIWLLEYFNIISEKSLLNIKSSKIFKIISGCVALGGGILALMEVIKKIVAQAA